MSRRGIGKAQHEMRNDHRSSVALGVSVTEVLRGAGMDVTSVTYATDDASAVRRALSQEGVDVVISTGGTGHGHGDHLIPALLRLNAEVLVRGVSMRPGHPTVLAALVSLRYGFS